MKMESRHKWILKGKTRHHKELYSKVKNFMLVQLDFLANFG